MMFTELDVLILVLFGFGMGYIAGIFPISKQQNKPSKQPNPTGVVDEE